MGISDTTPEAMSVQAEVFRRMGGPRRLEIAMEMSDAVRELTFARLKRDHPGFSRPEIIQAYVREVFGATGAG
jgi:hypothetical protein